VESFRAALRRQIPAADRVGVFPYQTVGGWSWHDALDPDRHRRYRGRTLVAGDPLLDTEPRLHGRAFDRPDEAGVLVTAEMLEELRGSWPPDKPLPVTLNILPEKVHLLGVLSHPLPGGLQFVVTETSAFDLLRRNPNPQAQEILSGPIPDAWKDWEKLPAAASGILAAAKSSSGQKLSLEWVGVKPRGAEEFCRWKFAVRRPPFPRLDEWQILLEKLRAAIPDGPLLAPQLPLLEPSRVLEPEKPVGAPEYDTVGVYLGGLSDLDVTLDAMLAVAEEQGLEANADVVAQLRALLRAGNRTRVALLCLLAALGLLALGNLYAFYNLRAQQKVVEIGMLKAMGLSAGLLNGIYLAEVALVWLIGAILGLGVGWGGGTFLANSLIADHPEEAAVAFSCPWLWWRVGILAGSLATSLASIWWATRKARRASAMKSLAGG
jgi:hypothetical protein